MNQQAKLKEIAARVVWWKTPEDALANELHFLAHAMTYGTFEDACLLEKYFGQAKLKTVLNKAPAGVFDPRSWNFWHLHLHLPLKKMPTRF